MALKLEDYKKIAEAVASGKKPQELAKEFGMSKVRQFFVEQVVKRITNVVSPYVGKAVVCLLIIGVVFAVLLALFQFFADLFAKLTNSWNYFWGGTSRLVSKEDVEEIYEELKGQNVNFGEIGAAGTYSNNKLFNYDSDGNYSESIRKTLNQKYQNEPITYRNKLDESGNAVIDKDGNVVQEEVKEYFFVNNGSIDGGESSKVRYELETPEYNQKLELEKNADDELNKVSEEIVKKAKNGENIDNYINQQIVKFSWENDGEYSKRKKRVFNEIKENANKTEEIKDDEGKVIGKNNIANATEIKSLLPKKTYLLAVRDYNEEILQRNYKEAVFYYLEAYMHAEKFTYKPKGITIDGNDAGGILIDNDHTNFWEWLFNTKESQAVFFDDGAYIKGSMEVNGATVEKKISITDYLIDYVMPWQYPYIFHANTFSPDVGKAVSDLAIKYHQINILSNEKSQSEITLTRKDENKNEITNTIVVPDIRLQCLQTWYEKIIVDYDKTKVHEEVYDGAFDRIQFHGLVYDYDKTINNDFYAFFSHPLNIESVMCTFYSDYFKGTTFDLGGKTPGGANKMDAEDNSDGGDDPNMPDTSDTAQQFALYGDDDWSYLLGGNGGSSEGGAKASEMVGRLKSATEQVLTAVNSINASEHYEDDKQILKTAIDALNSVVTTIEDNKITEEVNKITDYNKINQLRYKVENAIEKIETISKTDEQKEELKNAKNALATSIQGIVATKEPAVIKLEATCQAGKLTLVLKLNENDKWDNNGKDYHSNNQYLITPIKLINLGIPQDKLIEISSYMQNNLGRDKKEVDSEIMKRYSALTDNMLDIIKHYLSEIVDYNNLPDSVENLGLLNGRLEQIVDYMKSHINDRNLYSDIKEKYDGVFLTTKTLGIIRDSIDIKNKGSVYQIIENEWVPSNLVVKAMIKVPEAKITREDNITGQDDMRKILFPMSKTKEILDAEGKVKEVKVDSTGAVKYYLSNNFSEKKSLEINTAAKAIIKSLHQLFDSIYIELSATDDLEARKEIEDANNIETISSDPEDISAEVYMNSPYQQVRNLIQFFVSEGALNSEEVLCANANAFLAEMNWPIDEIGYSEIIDTRVGKSEIKCGSKAKVLAPIYGTINHAYNVEVDEEGKVIKKTKKENVYEITNKYGTIIIENLKIKSDIVMGTTVSAKTELGETIANLVIYRIDDAAKQNSMYQELTSYVVTQKSDYAWPVPGYYTITSPYGYRNDPMNSKENVKEFHNGIDIAGTNIQGMPIVAMYDGKVTKMETTTEGYGNNIIVAHGMIDGKEVSTRYCHMMRFKDGLSVDSMVKKGDIVGWVGTTGRSTGYHLHFMVTENGTAVNPLFNGRYLWVYYENNFVSLNN